MIGYRGEGQLSHRSKSPKAFQTQVIERFTVDVARKITLNFQFKVGDISEVVAVTTEASLIEHPSTSVGHVVDQRAIEEMPLNGRYFLDLVCLFQGR